MESLQGSYFIINHGLAIMKSLRDFKLLFLIVDMFLLVFSELWSGSINTINISLQALRTVERFHKY